MDLDFIHTDINKDFIKVKLVLISLIWLSRPITYWAKWEKGKQQQNTAMFKKDRRQKLAEKKQQNTIPKSPIIVRTQDKQYSQIKHVYPKCNISTRFSKRTCETPN